jgi:integration host factor subunit beta
MLRSELVRALKDRHLKLKAPELELLVDQLFDEITNALEKGNRVELRGFGAFSVRKRKPRQGRNPRNGKSVAVAAKQVPFFKPGKELRMKVNGGVDYDPSDDG